MPRSKYKELNKTRKRKNLFGEKIERKEDSERTITLSTTK